MASLYPTPTTPEPILPTSGLDGEMSVPTPASAANPMQVGSDFGSGGIYTLNEPISATIMRDLRKVWAKLRTVLIPSTPQEETLKQLRDWDLWGPLLLCLVLSILMSLGAPDGQKALVFSSVFVIGSVGAAVVTFNAQLLGGKISFFQSVCVLGYCICPLVIACVLGVAWSNSIWRAILVVIAYLWSTKASVVFMSDVVPESRKVLAVYPVCLFYLLISWMVYIQ